MAYYYDVTKEDINEIKKEYPHLKSLEINDDPLKIAKKNMEILLKEKYPLYSFVLKLSRTSTTNKVTISVPDYKEDNPIDKHEVYQFLSEKFKESKRDIDNDADLPIAKEQAIFQKAFGSTTHIGVVRVPANEKQMSLYNKLILEQETEHVRPNKNKLKY